MNPTPDHIPQYRLGCLFLIHAMALAAWMVPLTNVLDSNGLSAIKPFAYGAAALAAMTAPLFFGAMADHRIAPIRVMRALTAATSVSLALATMAIHLHWHPALVLTIILVQSLCSAPTFSISVTIVLARLPHPERQFGPIRSMGTFGWIAGCWIVSALKLDASTIAGFLSAVLWMGLSLWTLSIPAIRSTASPRHLTFRERLGLDALTLLKSPNHRGVFITAALLSIPLAAFYPYTPPHLLELGMERTSAWMTLGQMSEVMAMFAMAGLLARFRIRHVLLAGLTFSVLRFALCAMGSPATLRTGIFFHGFSYTLFFITSQIYVEKSIDPAWRARAQALFALMTGGIGSLIGYLGSGWWYRQLTPHDPSGWMHFWIGLTLAAGVAMVFFMGTYRGRGSGRDPDYKKS